MSMMTSYLRARTLTNALITVCAISLASTHAMADPFSVLHDFTAGADGAVPGTGVVLDTLGNFYGTTLYGADTSVVHEGAGTIFKGDASGKVTTLHDFDTVDGFIAMNPLLLDADTLFDSTQLGSNFNGGVVFSIKTDGSAYTILHDFAGLDGYFPYGPLAKLPGFGLVGVTIEGGSQFTGYTGGNLGRGVLFGIARDGRFGVLHNFEVETGDFPDKVLAGGAGTLFGSTAYGGGCPTAGGCGVVFRYDLTTHAYTVIYSFSGGSDGVQPVIGSIGPDGSLYGTSVISKFNITFAPSQDAHMTGTLFKLTPAAGVYRLSILANFNQATGEPSDGPVLLRDGSLIGYSTKSLYSYRDEKITILHEFGQDPKAYAPTGQPAIGRNGIVGATANGGVTPCYTSTGQAVADYCGTLFHYGPQMSPSAPSPVHPAAP